MKQHRASVLSPGKAPACWQRELTRRTARSERLQRLCAWLKPFAETQPRLRDGPLWGNCLAELTGEVVQPEQSGSGMSPPRHNWATSFHREEQGRWAPDRMDESAIGHGVQASRMRPSAQPPRQSSSLAGFSPPTELKRQVTLDMLDRLAGEALREVDVRRITSAQEPGRKVTKPQDTSSVAVTAKTMSPRDWIRNVARRAWHAFGVTGMDEIPVLNKQWTTRLNGEPALPELLLRPLARPTNNDRPSNRQVRDGPTPRQLSEAELDQPRVPVQTTSTGKEPTQAPLPVSGWTGEVESEWVSSEHIVPPAVAPSLPHLLPPQIVNEPAPALATMIARQASRQEATQVEVDLAQLATNIKRILDEEARRHGIDV